MNTVPILYEDNHLLVVVKPANLLSQGDRTGDDDLLSMLKGYLKEKYQKPGNVFLGLVHRLDRPVGGVMVFAKTSKAARRLSEQIRKNDLEKGYLAVVWGRPSSGGYLRDYLLKNRRTNMVRVVGSKTKGAQEARLEYKVLAEAGFCSLVQVRLITGRSHQIRVQMAHAGHPLVGDRRYGKSDDRFGQIALWAESLSFQHPTSQNLLTFDRPPPSKPPWNRFFVP